MKQLYSVLALPFNVTITLPALLLFFQYEAGTEPFRLPVLINYLDWLFAAFGFCLLSWTVVLFATKGKGTLAPWSPPTRLVIMGPYKYVRNPMISGVLFVLIGEALLFKSFWLLGWCCFFFLLNHLNFLLKEEPDLEERFGEDYLKYKKGVNRWIPRFTPYTSSS